MFSTIDDFLKDWKYESEATLKVLRNLTDSSLEQRVGPDDRTLGLLAWHIATSMPEMLGQAGIPFPVTLEAGPAPTSAAVLMRQAGLKVPGVYGPAREEWAAMGMPAEP